MLAKNPFVNMDCSVVLNEKLSRHTTLRVGGEAKFFARPQSVLALVHLLKRAQLCDVKVKIIGNGSNILFSDSGYDGLIISLKKLKGIKQVSRRAYRVYAGETLSALINFLSCKNLSGIEELWGIPATVGGAVYQNAGAFGKSVGDAITEVTYYDGAIKTFSVKDCNFDYRKSVFHSLSGIILSATFNLTDRPQSEIKETMCAVAERRKAKQPTGRTCGSVFKNPTTVSAGALIERAGLKGFRVGGAKVSEKHANFIINENGTAQDVYLLIRYVKQKVLMDSGIKLTEEVETVGDFE